MSSEAAALFARVITDVALSAPNLSRAGSGSNDSLDRSNLLDRAAGEQSDEKLMCQIQSGSKDALAVLFRRHSSPVLGVGKRILRDSAEAEDLLQEVFLFVYQKAALFDSTKGSAISWIIQVTYHRALNRRKYLNARQHYDARSFEEEFQRPMDAPTALEEIASRELLNQFRAELNAEQRQVLELHFYEGYTFHEIAGKTGQTLGNVRHHYYRGLERLRSFVFPKKRS
ncbi:RNA polymerase sigma factor [Terriglobus roseus]|uniref:RNA polymerase sigma factor n=1 Tax=Terriglobus roseus TaxID=392734 RepID=A0A1H4K362_9BACT|nr:sigma-70 family RNA polymerase sigma factor [Terriglobus roseus]SEB52332.1 RNA polymerase sigma-70 factor, ECF subfamily [Terriglobus roseus]